MLQETPPKGKYTSITAIDLIQRKKLDSRKCYESNLTEARYLILYRSIIAVFGVILLFTGVSHKYAHSFATLAFVQNARGVLMFSPAKY